MKRTDVSQTQSKVFPESKDKITKYSKEKKQKSELLRQKRQHKHQMSLNQCSVGILISSLAVNSILNELDHDNFISE